MKAIRPSNAEEYIRKVEEIDTKAERGEKLTYLERRLLYMASPIKTDPKLLVVCKDIRFEDLHDKQLFGDREGNYINAHEKEELDLSLSDWLTKLESSQNTGDLLMFVRKEIKSKLKEYDDSSQTYAEDVKSLQMYSMRVYNKALMNFEELSRDQLLLKLNGKEIEVSFKSFVHILIQHFAPSQKQHNPNKTHFPRGSFFPDEMVENLKKIFYDIDKSGLYVNGSVYCINFKFKEQDYRIYCVDDGKTQKGIKGTITYIRLSTFYPVELLKDKTDIQTNYTLKPINNDLGVYLKNTLDISPLPQFTDKTHRFNK